jgi:PAS domain S-box-containing protein
MSRNDDTIKELRGQVEQLQSRLREAEDTLDAIRTGGVDALLVSGPHGDQVYTLTGADSVYRLLFETMEEGSATLGPDGSIFFCNSKLSTMLNTPMETILGGSILRFVPEEDAASLAVLLKKGLEEPQKKEIVLKSRDGQVVPCQVSTSPLALNGSSVICMILTDLTERKRVEEDLIRSNKDLQQFAYVASHDLQEPLRNVASCLQLLEKEYKDKLDADADQYIRYAVEGAVRMKALILDLLTYSRVATKVRAPERINCEQLLDKTLDGLSVLISEAGAVITYDPLPIVFGDQSQLLQVFQNLIQNAIKFRRDERPQIHVSAAKKGNEWIFAVKDNGIGIESQHLDRIFVIFQQLHKRGKYEGAGMGLAIGKKIIERHGGRIWAESQPGAGTTIYFTIHEKEDQG